MGNGFLVARVADVDDSTSRTQFGPNPAVDASWAQYEAPEGSQGTFHGVEEGACAVLEAAWRADPRQAPHQQAEIQAAGVDQEALADVRVAPQMHPAQAPGFIEVGVGSLKAFSAEPLQPPRAGAAGSRTRRRGRRACRASVAGHGPVSDT